MAELELIGLSKRYGSVVALDSLSFSVGAGEVFGFVGPNGAGKTSAMRIVLGVLAADSGEVRWRGRPVDAELRRRIGYMPEERGLYPKMRAAEQLRYFALLHGLGEAQAEAAAARWLERLGLAERAEDPVEELSLGNQQRVQLGAALVHEPDLLVLDEPFSGLDPVGVEVLSEVIRAEARERGVPVIFSSHQLELVERLCDGVAIVKDGRLIAAGGVAELREERSRNRWEVVADGTDGTGAGGDALAAALAELDGVRAVGDSVYELAPGADPQRLLDRARELGPVRRFGPRRPSLAELFREAVAEQEPDSFARTPSDGGPTTRSDSEAAP